MKFYTTLGFTVASALFAQSVVAQPTSGAYVTDLVNSYVNDDGLRTIDNVAQIMCFMGSMRPEQKVGAGNYKALVDKKKCEKSSSETTSAGASSAVNYVNAVVKATRATDADPMNVNAWVVMKESYGLMTIYTKTAMSAGASSSAPSGVFTMSFGGYADAQPNTPVMKGTLSASGSTVNFYEEGNNGSAFTTALTLTQSGVDSGSGRTRSTTVDSTTNITETTDSTFAYNSTHFKRNKTGKAGHTAPQCFKRAAADADASTWGYGVYNADGSRLDLANPGFQITYTTAGTTYYGYASYYGVFFPDTVLAAMGASATVNRPGSASSYNYSKVGGKLTKLTKMETTLANVKGMPVRLWNPTGGEFELVWDGNNFTKKRTMSCNQDGCASTAATGNVTAADLRLGSLKVVQGWADSVGGPVMVRVPDTGEFSSTTPVYYRTRSTVAPAQAQALNLQCTSQCLGGSAAMAAALPVSMITGPDGIPARIDQVA